MRRKIEAEPAKPELLLTVRGHRLPTDTHLVTCDTNSRRFARSSRHRSRLMTEGTTQVGHAKAQFATDDPRGPK